MGLKPSDYRAIPLCQRHHATQHQTGEKAFWQLERIDPRRVMIRCMNVYLREACGFEAPLSVGVTGAEVRSTLLELVKLIEAQRPARFQKEPKVKPQ